MDEKIKKSLHLAGIEPKLSASKASMLSIKPRRDLQLSKIENYLKRKKSSRMGLRITKKYFIGFPT